MFFKFVTDLKSVFTNIFIVGIADKLLRGLKSLNVLIPDTFEIRGTFYNIALKTTVKSSQFHPSRK